MSEHGSDAVVGRPEVSVVPGYRVRRYGSENLETFVARRVLSGLAVSESVSVLCGTRREAQWLERVLQRLGSVIAKGRLLGKFWLRRDGHEVYLQRRYRQEMRDGDHFFGWDGAWLGEFVDNFGVLASKSPSRGAGGVQRRKRRVGGEGDGQQADG